MTVVQEPDQIVPVRPAHLDDAKDQEIGSDAKQFADSVISDPTNFALGDRIFDLGSGARNLIDTQVSLFDTAIGVVLKDINADGDDSYAFNRVWNLKLEQHLYDDRIIYSNTTRYQHLVVTHNPTLDEYRFYINGHIQYSTTDEARYHESLVHPAMQVAVSRKKVLILGGGDGMTLREVLKYDDVESVDLVDLDRDMVRLSATHPVLRRLNHGAFDEARIRVVDALGVETGDWYYLFQENGRQNENKLPDTEKVATLYVTNIDADKFLSNARKRYDIVFIDLPDPSTIELNKLYTRGFYSKVRRLLSDGGAVAVQATSPYFARESYWCISRTIAAAGLDTVNYHVNVESFGDWGLVLASKSLKKGYAQERIARMTLEGVDTKYLTADVFRAATVFGKDMLQVRYNEINTVMRPVLNYYYLVEDWQYG